MKKALAVLLIGAMALSMVACGSSDTTSTTTDANTETSEAAEETADDASATTETASTDDGDFVWPAGDGVLQTLGVSEDILSAYNGYAGEINANPWSDWEGKEGPWTVYFCQMALENDFEIGAQEFMDTKFAEYQEAGLVDEYVSLNANNDLTTQIQQVQTAIEAGADIIYLVPCSDTGLNNVIEQAYNAGIPVVTYSLATTSPYAMFAGLNQYAMGTSIANQIVDSLDGEGDVLMITGIAGTSADTQQIEAMEKVFEANPGINVVGEVNGDWSPSVAKTNVMQFFATHAAQNVDAIAQQGNMFNGIYEAVEQSGREGITINIGDGKECELAAAAANQDSDTYSICGIGNQPSWQAEAAFEIGILTLMGCGPKINDYVFNAPIINADNWQEWYNDSYTIDSTAYVEAPDSVELYPDDFLSAMFTNYQPLPQ